MMMMMRRIFLPLIWASAPLWPTATAAAAARKNLIIDTDLFSDVDDTGALLLAATSPDVNLLAVNVNYPSSYSALAASALLAHYGHPDVSIGAARPLTDESFFDDYSYALGEYASKVAYRYSGGSLPWGGAEKAWDPVDLYRRMLAGAEDGSVTVVSVGFLDNLSGLMNSTADAHSNLTGPALIASKVCELVVMGGGYPSGHEFNFFGYSPLRTAHVVNNWPGKMVFSGSELGGNVTSGGRLMAEGPEDDPTRRAYVWYTYGAPRFSWDPLTVLYAVGGLGDVFAFGNEVGYNHVFLNGSNEWVFDEGVTDQRWLRLRVSNETASARLDELYLRGARMASNSTAA
ncbi:inosine/uridine-preferring nucleoside hydrolase [Xylariaceae sp. FL0016]|nr:inosine/uridine-preferring nucleoside hydrolase [Xylariaceae sp. FL0016]